MQYSTLRLAVRLSPGGARGRVFQPGGERDVGAEQPDPRNYVVTPATNGTVWACKFTVDPSAVTS